jgi:hypothetical protein
MYAFKLILFGWLIQEDGLGMRNASVIQWRAYANIIQTEI